MFDLRNRALGYWYRKSKKTAKDVCCRVTKSSNSRDKKKESLRSSQRKVSEELAVVLLNLFPAGVKAIWEILLGRAKKGESSSKSKGFH